MNMGDKKIERKYYQPANLGSILVIFLCAIAVLNFLQINNPSQVNMQDKSDQWHVEVTAKELPITSNSPIILQTVLMTNDGGWIEGANIKATLTMDGAENKEIQFQHVEDGLYEYATQMGDSGTWSGELEVKKDNGIMTRPLEIVVVPR
ncbi:FixH family protein [Evansella sp. AB-P1]|uniref:FixH family protein n=1 Tax=Evansella sp. AB-P1 TaxID=3037653 RepID=UPI00241C3FB6|nr:FixH family protein [Evansella sp. AB-P1]MDG5786300.1 FixH family protein [Evansella sp. AB-P1]